MTNAIGGYHELELRKGEHYHKTALRLNTARNCFEYVLRVRKYTKVYVPYYTCEVMLEPLHKCNVDYEFYHINQQLEPDQDFNLQPTEAFLYTNYYGLKQRCVERLAQQYGKQLIVDNAQAFFAVPLDGIDTFYSARKFFGVADGAYLYIDKLLDEELELDQSYDRMIHLLKRADVGAEAGYADFRRNDDSLIGQPIKRMSKITEKILCSIDYESIKSVRRENFIFLQQQLQDTNNLQISLPGDAIPMFYPYLAQDISLRKILIDNRIYVPTFWPNIEEWCADDDYEVKLMKLLLLLPISQYYRIDDISNIVCSK